MVPLLLAIAALPAGCPAAPGWTYAAPAPDADRAQNVLRADRDDVMFNDIPISYDVLSQYADQAMRIEPTPLLVLDTTNIDCNTLQRIQNAVARGGRCPEFVCYAYDMPPAPPPPAPPIKWMSRR